MVLSGGPTWDVPKEERWENVEASETIQLPAPTFKYLNCNCNKASLSEAYPWMTLRPHYWIFPLSSFQNRICNFNARHDIDPTMHPLFAESFKECLPDQKQGEECSATMDLSSTTFDNTTSS
ncbi:hypothetical protein F3Y22_tig00110159pilonHSYRG00201 [Hibiscus syriacus]|uniref:Uncharacterized protein n=1 Tax=Hibiscus syriacus TaxID=106335 RepID=A0A6A3BFS0_HIBSY|nr:hypothetical protein F3Y22_tig00110159pilonHSYRG00201 [Hibiscus syriacus]